MDLQAYLSGYVAGKRKPFTPYVEEEHFSVQTLGFVLMESDFYSPPVQPEYLRNVTIIKKEEAV